MRMDELEAGWLQVSVVGEAGSKYERAWELPWRGSWRLFRAYG